MSRFLSQLRYVRVQDTPASPRIITLHDHQQDGSSVREFGLAAAPNGRVIGLESYKGVYIGRDVVGFTWFIGPQDHPSPVYFGDALAEIERFLWDEVDRQKPGAAELPFLVGVGQGGIMALAAAAAVPDLLSGVIAIDAFLPVVPGWEPPLTPLAGLPLLLIERAACVAPGDHVLHGIRLADAFCAWGAEVTREVGLDPGVPTSTLQRWIAAHSVRLREPDRIT
jgi:pimeloyl-ACP methyl ester carboxylesterase